MNVEETMRKVIITGVILCAQIFAVAIGGNNEQRVSESEQVAQKWVKASETFDKLVWSQSDTFLNLIESVVRDRHSLSINDKCVSSLQAIGQGFRQRQLWALQCKFSMYFVD